MSVLTGKKITLGISGSIAAYKTPQLVRLFVKEGAEVQVILTENAGLFVTALSLETVSKKPVLSSTHEAAHWNNHVLLGRSSDLLLLAPCSANTLAKMANGICDNLLLAVYLSAACPVMFAPAMDEDMWLHPATQANLTTLKHFGHYLIPVEEGFLASGLTGSGRMAEPETIVSRVCQYFENKENPIVPNGKRAMVSAGPTYEAIDPVRYLGNHSSGKMGVAIAEVLANKGFQVDLIAGPGVSLPDNQAIQVHSVTSASEMFDACARYFKEAAITVMAAAVADYRPGVVSKNKLKKKEEEDILQLKLVKNPDILAHLGKSKTKDQLLVGFALETDHEVENALQKIKTKNADFIVLNSLKDKGAGFGADTNKVTIISAQGDKYPLPLQSKQQTAEAIISCVLR